MPNITLQEAYNQAKEALEAGELDRSVAICQHVLRYYPRYVEGYRLLGEAYLEHGGLSEAGRLFSHVLSCDPQHVLAHVGRAIIAEEHGLVEVAISELERGFEVDPGIGELRAELLRLYKVRYGTAGAYIRTTPIGLAYTHLRAGLLEPAIAEFSRIGETLPDRWDGQVALLEALWRNEQLIDAASLAATILADHPNSVKANWILGYLHWTGDKLDSGREYLSAAVALDPDYGAARKLWANTPWPLDPVVTAEQPALVPGWGRGELVMEEDLNLALPLELDEEPLATTPARRVTAALALDDGTPAAASPHSTAPLADEDMVRSLEPAVPARDAVEAAPIEEPDGLEGGSLDVILPMPTSADEPTLPAPTSGLDTVLMRPVEPEAPPSDESEVDTTAMQVTMEAPAPATAPPPPPPPGDWFQAWAVAALNPIPAPPPAPPQEAPVIDAVPPEEREPAPAAEQEEPTPAPANDAPETALAEETPPPDVAAPVEDAPEPAPVETAAPADGEIGADDETTAESPPHAEARVPAADATELTLSFQPQEAAPATDTPPEAPGPPQDLAPANEADGAEGPDSDLPPAAQARAPAGDDEPPTDAGGDRPIPPSAPDEPTLAATAEVEGPEGDTAESDEDTEPLAPMEYQTVPISGTSEEVIEYLAVPEIEDATRPDEGADPLPVDAPDPRILIATDPAQATAAAPAAPTPADESLSAVDEAPAPPLDETTNVPVALEEMEPAPPPLAASGDDATGPLMREAALPTEAAQPVSAPPAPEDSLAVVTAPDPLSTSEDVPAVSIPDDGHLPAPSPETVADSAMKENTMAPSYKEDDDQERQFEFDWEREGLPDYLKPFLAEDSAPAAVPPTPPASPANTGGFAFGGGTADTGQPAWLNTPASNAPAVPGGSMGGMDSFGVAPGAPSPGGFGAPPPAGAGGNLDAEGLPDWLRSSPGPAQPAAPRPAPPAVSARGGNLDDEGLPSWLQGSTPSAPPPAPTPFGMSSDNMDSEGLPSWLQGGPPSPPAPAPQGGTGGVQPFDFGGLGGNLGGVQPFDFGAGAAPQGGVQPFDFGATPAPQGGMGNNVQPFDFGGLGGDMGGVQPFDVGGGAAPAPQGGMGNPPAFDFGPAPSAPAPAAPQGGMGNVQPFDFGNMGADLGGVQPFDFGGAASPPAPQGGMGSIPAFDFGASPAPPAQTGGMGSNVAPFDFSSLGGDLGGVQPFDFGGGAAPAPPPAGGGMGNVQPFDFGNMGADLGGVQPFDFGGGAAPAPQGGLGNVQPFDFGAPTQPAQPGGWSSPAPTEDVDDFLDYLNSADETPAASGSVDLSPPGVQPFSFDNFDFGAALPPAPPVPPVALPPPPTDMAPFNPEEFNFQPFSFGQEPGAALGDNGLGGTGPFGEGSGLGGIQPFSFDDMQLDLPANAGGAGSFGRRAGDHAEFDDEEEEENRGYSWQRPSGGTPRRRERPQEEAPEPAGESIFAKARRRKEELEAVMRAAATPEPEPVVPAAEIPEPLEATDLWPTFDEEEAAVAFPTVPAQPVAPFSPALAAADDAAAAVDEFDFSMLDASPTGEVASPAAFDMNAVQPFDFSAFEAAPEVPVFDFTSLDVAPVPPTPASAESFEFGAGTGKVPVAATPDLTPGQPEQLWSVPIETTPAEAAAGGEFDFSGLPRFDLAEMGLTPEEQAYLLNESALSSTAALDSAPAPAQPAGTFGDQEGLPSWLSGESTPAPAIPEPMAELESNALPSWMSGMTTPAGPETTPAPAEPWIPPTFDQPEPMVAEVFGEEDMQAWPAPAEPLTPSEREVPAFAADEQAPAFAPAEPAFAADEQAPAFAPAEPVFAAPEPIQSAPTLEERITPTAPALRFSGEPAVEEIHYNPPLPPIAAPLELAPARPVAASVAPPAGGHESVDDILQHLQDNPSDAAARLVLAGVYEEREDYRRALEQYRLLIKNREVPGNVMEIVLDNLRALSEELPDDATIHRVLGDAYRKAGMFQAAISQYNWLLSQGAK